MTLIEIASLFGEQKASLVGATGLDKDALHIYFGLTLFLLVRLMWRWRGGWLIAWAAVLAMAVGGEWLDLTREVSDAALQPDAEHWHDVWNTMFWPTVLLLIGRWLQPRPKSPGEASDTAIEYAIRVDRRQPEPVSATKSGEHAEHRLEQA